MPAKSCFSARFKRALFLVCTLLLFATVGHAMEPVPLVLRGLGRTSLPVDGTWQFHEGDDIAWASPAFDDSAWQPIEVGRTWEEQGHRGLTGFACALANAGHLPPYLNAAEVQSPPALPLGLLPTAEYEEVRFHLTEVDRLTLDTDGLLEARNQTGELFGFTRITRLLADTGDAERIADAAQHFGQDDDITVLTVAMAMAPAEVAVRSAQWAAASTATGII